MFQLLNEFEDKLQRITFPREGFSPFLDFLPDHEEHIKLFGILRNSRNGIEEEMMGSKSPQTCIEIHITNAVKKYHNLKLK